MSMYISDLWPFYIGRFVRSFTRIINPFETLYYLGIGLSYTQVATILVVQNLVTLIFEVPISKFAERYGNKISVILGFIFTGIFCVMIPLVKEFSLLLVLSGFVSFFKTLYGGKDIAWVGEVIKKNCPNFLIKYFGYSKSLTNLGVVFVGILGTFIVDYTGTMNYVWVASGVAFILVGLILMFGEKGYVRKMDNTGGVALLRKYYKEGITILLSSKNEKIYLIKKRGKKLTSLFLFIKMGIEELLKNKMIIFLFVGMSLIFVLRYVGKMFWGPYFQEIGFDISKLGRLYSATGILGILFPLVIPLLKNNKHQIIYFLMIIIFLGSFIILSLCLGNIILLIIAYLITDIVDEFIYPLDSTFSVDMINKESRAVILSLRDSVKAGFVIIGSLFSGLLFDNSSLLWGGVIIFMLIILIGLNYAFLLKKHNI